MKFKALTDAYKAGHVDPKDLDGVTAEDWLKAREEAGDGVLQLTVSADSLIGGDNLFGNGDGEADAKPKKKGGKPYSYLFVSDDLIPPFNDRVESKAWDLKEFKYRGSMILYDHNIDASRPPIGTATNVQKGVEMKRGGRDIKALTGDISFADRDVYPFAGMVEDMVEAGILRGGSVGFRIKKARPATEKEQEEMGMASFSSVIQKASLYEYSITPVGRDMHAQRMSAGTLDPIEAKLVEFAEAGVYEDDVIAEFRESIMRGAGQAERVSIVVPELPKTADEGPFTSDDDGTGATFTITNDPPQIAYIPAVSTTEGAVTQSYADAQRAVIREEIVKQRQTENESFLARIEALEDEVTELKNRTVYDELFDLADTTTTSGEDGDADPMDQLFTVAEDLGFTA